MPNDHTPNGDHLEFSTKTDAFIPDDGPRHGKEDEDYELTKATGPEAARTGDVALESLCGLMLELGLTRQYIEENLAGKETLLGNGPNFIKPPENNDLSKFLARLSEQAEAAKTLRGNGPNFIKPPENNDLSKFLARLSEQAEAAKTLRGNGPNF